VIPYIYVGSFPLGHLRVSSFVTLAGLGCLAACALTVWRGRRFGLSYQRTEEMCLWAVLAAYFGAHLGNWIYYPEDLSLLAKHPQLVLRSGLSSFGGFLGGLVGIALFFVCRRVRGGERWRYADAIAYSLPFAGILGRLGCSLVHDHPGLRTTNWLAVRYPDAPRWDLGLLELFFLTGLAAVFLALDRKHRASGFYFGLFFLSYGLFRLGLDQLHVDPPRYLGWTVDEYAALAAIIVGGLSLARVRRPVPVGAGARV
jgi:phosphatidylglycerol:prolipoprotein diacylglycerol transferase